MKNSYNEIFPIGNKHSNRLQTINQETSRTKKIVLKRYVKRRVNNYNPTQLYSEIAYNNMKKIEYSFVLQIQLITRK